jgi:hypothetical protein
MNNFDYKTALINLLKSVLITKCGADTALNLKLLELRQSSYLQIYDESKCCILDLKFFTDAEDDYEIIPLLDEFIDYFKGEFDHE